MQALLGTAAGPQLSRGAPRRLTLTLTLALTLTLTLALALALTQTLTLTLALTLTLTRGAPRRLHTHAARRHEPVPRGRAHRAIQLALSAQAPKVTEIGVRTESG